MLFPLGTTVAVADGSKLKLYQNTEEGSLSLKALPDAHPEKESAGSGGHHHNSSANPSQSQIAEDDFAAGIADMLNHRVQSGEIKQLIVVAAPRTLGELRKHYSKQVSAALVTELAKDLTGHSLNDIEKTLKAA